MAEFRIAGFPDFTQYDGFVAYGSGNGDQEEESTALADQDINNKFIQSFQNDYLNRYRFFAGGYFAESPGQDIQYSYNTIALVNHNFEYGSMWRIISREIDSVDIIVTSIGGGFHTNIDPLGTDTLTNNSGSATGSAGDVDEGVSAPDSNYINLGQEDSWEGQFDSATGTPGTQTNGQLIRILLYPTSGVVDLQVEITTDLGTVATHTFSVNALSDSAHRRLVEIPWTFPSGADKSEIRVIITNNNDGNPNESWVRIHAVSWYAEQGAEDYDSGWATMPNLILDDTDTLSLNEMPMRNATFFFPSSRTDNKLQVEVRDWDHNTYGANRVYDSTVTPDAPYVGKLVLGNYTDVALLSLLLKVKDATLSDESYGGNKKFDPRPTRRVFETRLQASFDTGIKLFLNQLLRLSGKGTPVLITCLPTSTDYTEALTIWATVENDVNTLEWVNKYLDNNSLSLLETRLSFEEII